MVAGVGARQSLDARLQRLAPLLNEPRPHRGWIRAVRDALGMSGRELAARMGVSQGSVVDVETSEVHGTVKLETLRRAAHALDCELVYFFVPRTSLDDIVRTQARRQAAQHLSRVGHHSALEEQELSQRAASEQLERFAGTLVDKRGLWSDQST